MPPDGALIGAEAHRLLSSKRLWRDRLPVKPAVTSRVTRPMRVATLGGTCLFALASANALFAQALPEDVLPESELDDPIGIDRDSRSLEQAATRKPAKAPATQPVKILARTGEVLTAVPSAREQRHLVRVELAPGLARIETTIELVSKAKEPAEVRYRLALPRATLVTGLEVCGPSACRAAVLEPSALATRAYEASVLGSAPPLPSDKPAPAPIARAELDVGGTALLIHAAPLSAKHALTLRVRAIAEAPLHGGSVRMLLPQRGMDPRAAPTEIEVHASDLLEPRAAFVPAEGPIRTEPWVEVPISARVADGSLRRSQVLAARCPQEGSNGLGPCTRIVAWAASSARAPRDVVIALDVSPSTEGPARGRLLPAITALLETAPAGSTVRVLAFAANARVLVGEAIEPTLLSLAPLAEAIRGADAAELGAATRLESALDAFESMPRRKHGRARPLLVVVGDGGLTEGQGRPFERARKAGLEVSVLNLSDRSTTTGLQRGAQQTGGIVIEAGPEAEQSARGRDHVSLHERLAALFLPNVAQVTLRTVRGRVELGPLRAGESLGAIVPGRAQLMLGAQRASPRGHRERSEGWLAKGHAWLAVDGRMRGVAARSETQPACATAARRTLEASGFGTLALAEARACHAARAGTADQTTAGLGKGMPKDPLLDMLRQRVLPIARGCFRSDRKGRAKYDKRAVFAFTLGDREVIAATVEGAISERLRACLLDAVDSLEVPRFTGLVRVRYPLVTESVPEPEQIELTAGAAREVDSLLPPAETAGNARSGRESTSP